MATTKVKGARANKPNDSFGVINDKNLYRNKYREDVYKDDEEQPEETQDPTPEVATQEKTRPSENSFVEAKQTEEVPKHTTIPKEEGDSKEDSEMVLMLS